MKYIFSALLILFSSYTWAGAVSVENAYVRHMPPTQTVTGAFMILKNSSDQDISVLSAHSDVAERTELHTHINDNGMMRMRQVEKISIPAHGETSLQPGGLHVMLIGLKQPLEMGQIVTIDLNLLDGSSAQVQAEVRSVLGGMKEHAGQSAEHGGKAAEHGGKPAENAAKSTEHGGKPAEHAGKGMTQ